MPGVEQRLFFQVWVLSVFFLNQLTAQLLQPTGFPDASAIKLQAALSTCDTAKIGTTAIWTTMSTCVWSLISSTCSSTSSESSTMSGVSSSTTPLSALGSTTTSTTARSSGGGGSPVLSGRRQRTLLHSGHHLAADDVIDDTDDYNTWKEDARLAGSSDGDGSGTAGGITARRRMAATVMATNTYYGQAVVGLWQSEYESDLSARRSGPTMLYTVAQNLTGGDSHSPGNRTGAAMTRWGKGLARMHYKCVG